MAVVDDILEQLRTIEDVSCVFDGELPDRYTVSATPVLVLHHISSTPAITIDGTVIGAEGRWQVSVHGSKLHNVRLIAQAVATALHGFSSSLVQSCDYDSWPGTRRESTAPLEYHAPVDFIVQS